jgi:hypothetical protein
MTARLDAGLVLTQAVDGLFAGPGDEPCRGIVQVRVIGEQ